MAADAALMQPHPPSLAWLHFTPTHPKAQIRPHHVVSRTQPPHALRTEHTPHLHSAHTQPLARTRPDRTAPECWVRAMRSADSMEGRDSTCMAELPSRSPRAPLLLRFSLLGAGLGMAPPSLTPESEV